MKYAPGDDDGFFLACNDFFFFWGGGGLTIHAPPVHAHQFHFVGQDQPTLAQQAELTVAECSLMSCM